MAVNSRAKGARNERAWAAMCRSEGYTQTIRGCQFAGGPDTPDIKSADPELERIHFEVKSGKRIDVWGLSLKPSEIWRWVKSPSAPCIEISTNG